MWSQFDQAEWLEKYAYQLTAIGYLVILETWTLPTYWKNKFVSLNLYYASWENHRFKLSSLWSKRSYLILISVLFIIWWYYTVYWFIKYFFENISVFFSIRSQTILPHRMFLYSKTFTSKKWVAKKNFE